MNTYSTSSGYRVTKATLDRRVRQAKRNVLDQMRLEYGYVFCVDCKMNENSGVFIDCSHDISVSECQNSGRAELAWDESNIKPRCRLCHEKLDLNNVQWNL